MIFRRAVIVLFILVLGACSSTGVSSGYEKYYKASSGQEAGQAITTPTAGQPATIRVAVNLDHEKNALRDTGYVVLGESEFMGPMEDDKGILRQADKIGATLVLKSVEFSKTQPKFKKVYTRNEGINYVPIIANREDQGSTDAEGAQQDPRYVVEDLYKHSVIFLARSN